LLELTLKQIERACLAADRDDAENTDKRGFSLKFVTGNRKSETLKLETRSSETRNSSNKTKHSP
jgi:hypothetical protein